jgi:phosphatidate cytidylyltransferase
LLKQRVITAVILALLVSGGILLLPLQGLACLFSLLVLCGAWEWAGMSGLDKRAAKFAYTLGTALLIAVGAWYSGLLDGAMLAMASRDIFGLACIWWSIALLWVMSYPASAGLWGSTLCRCLMGWLVLVPALLALVYLHQLNGGIALIFILVALVASADIGAYFAGRAWGKAKLAAAVSPGKSWAGFWGGLAASSAFIVLVWALWGQQAITLPAALAIAVSSSLASVLGDLLESMVKRHQGIKDSGTILPGHGGMMDRLDSITAAAPVFTLGVILAGWH